MATFDRNRLESEVSKRLGRNLYSTGFRLPGDSAYKDTALWEQPNDDYHEAEF
jgi:hypothetical protein